MAKHPNLSIDAPATVITGDADIEITLARACATAAVLMTNDIPVAIWQNGETLFEYTHETDAPRGNDSVLDVVQGLAEDVIEAADKLATA
jgi:hypothetical protein